MRRLGLYLTSLVPAGMLLLALSGHRRYGYFVLLRLVVSIAAALLALMAHKQTAAGWIWVMTGILVLFNPLVPIHLRRDVRRLIDLAVAVIFIAAAFTMRSPQGARKATAPPLLVLERKGILTKQEVLAEITRLKA